MLQDTSMTTISALSAIAALLLTFAGPESVNQAPLTPVEQVGVCRASGIGRSFLRDAGAEALPIPECDLAVSIGDASISFFRAGDRTPLFLFSGRNGTSRGFDVELIGIGADPVRHTTSGRCMRLGRYSVICHAVFEDEGVRKGVALRFDLPAGIDLSRSRGAPVQASQSH
jgi:hypothetical protein